MGGTELRSGFKAAGFDEVLATSGRRIAISCSRSTAVLVCGIAVCGIGVWGIAVLETAGVGIAGAEEMLGAGRDDATLEGGSSNVPHIPQKRNFSELSSPHLGHLTIVLLRFRVALSARSVSQPTCIRYRWFKICPVSDHA